MGLGVTLLETGGKVLLEKVTLAVQINDEKEPTRTSWPEGKQVQGPQGRNYPGASEETKEARVAEMHWPRVRVGKVDRAGRVYKTMLGIWSLFLSPWELRDDFKQGVVWSDLLGWPKISFVFFYKMAVVVLSCLSSNETILLDYIVTAAISVCIKKKPYQNWWIFV